MSKIGRPVGISVVVPVYNSEDFIEKTISSVASQKHLPQELILVDDGSTDNTVACIKKLITSFPDLNIRLILEQHKGPGHARNIGVLTASCPWIAFLDSDDIWLPDKLSQFVMVQKVNLNANFFCHNEIHENIDGKKNLVDYGKGYVNRQTLASQLYLKNRFSTSAVICKRDLIIESGGFDEELSSAQDYELWLRISPNINLIFIQKYLGIYIVRVGNITSGSIWRRFKNTIIVLWRHRSKVSTLIFTVALIRVFIHQLIFSIINRYCIFYK